MLGCQLECCKGENEFHLNNVYALLYKDMLSTSRLAESQEDYTKVFNNVRKTTHTLASFKLRKLKTAHWLPK